MHQTSFPIENGTQQGVCNPRSSQNAYYADACILALTMHSLVINNAIFALIDSTTAPDIFSHRKVTPHKMHVKPEFPKMQSMQMRSFVHYACIQMLSVMQYLH